MDIIMNMNIDMNINMDALIWDMDIDGDTGHRVDTRMDVYTLYRQNFISFLYCHALQSHHRML